jgi:hypothetical protein
MKNKAAAEETTKTSIRLPRELWREAHIRALDEGRDLQDIIASALQAYVKTPLKRSAGGQR